MRINVAIADKNMEYLERLVGVLEENSDIRILEYSDEDSLMMAMDTRKFEVLLLDPSMYDSSFRLDDIPLTIFLVGDGNVPDGYREYPRISKYQRGSKIYQQLLALCANHLNLASSAEGGRATVVSFYSPLGGTGKTTTALVAATKLAMQGSRVLYVNLEHIPSDAVYLPQSDEDGLSSLLSRRSQKVEQVVLYMKSLLQTKLDKLFYLNHFDSLNDYPATTAEDIRWLLELFRNAGTFDVVVVDMSSSFDEKTRAILTMSDHIVLVETPTLMCRQKMEILLSQSIVEEDYSYKMMRVLNQYNGRESGWSTKIPQIGYMVSVTGVDSDVLITAKANSGESSFVSSLLR